MGVYALIKAKIYVCLDAISNCQISKILLQGKQTKWMNKCNALHYWGKPKSNYIIRNKTIECTLNFHPRPKKLQGWENYVFSREQSAKMKETEGGDHVYADDN